MLNFFENSAENKAYMQGYLSGKKADGLDWSLAEGRILDEKAEKEKAWREMGMIRDAALAKIADLEDENRRLREELRGLATALRSVSMDLEYAQRGKIGRRRV